MSAFGRWAPLIVLLIGALFVASAMAPKRDTEGEFRLGELGKIPVSHEGRVKPLDTVARNLLMGISGRQTYNDERGYSRPAIEWLLEVMSFRWQGNGRALKHKVFRIENDQVLSMLGLQERPGLRYAVEEFGQKIGLVERHAMRVRNSDPATTDLFDRKVVELWRKLQQYMTVLNLDNPQVLPPRGGHKEWGVLPLEEEAAGKDDPDVQAWHRILRAYAEGDKATFNAEVEKYSAHVRTAAPDETSKATFEAFFNSFQPFFVGLILYIVCFLLIFFSWMGLGEPAKRAALCLMLLGLAVHVFALIARMYIQERPLVFVTNLYSSAVFIGWITVILGLVLERFVRNGIGAMVGSGVGFVTLIIADDLAKSGDTMHTLQAVLDTNFWLSTHVTAITIGYAATFIAGALGIVFILMGLFSTKLQKEQVRNLGRITYGTICFATFFSFTGTVLGGIWADQSWGRFWGWDPKENGALMIVLWNALILHAKWGGMVRERGMAVLSVAGNIITTWSWFGVNMLGVGLHAYGFMDRALLWMILFVLSQIAIIGLGLIPPKYWASFKTEKESVRAV